MPDRLPPLNALRAFEAVGRHLNMTRAAQELLVTPAAVSHQVIALETYLGRKLFERLQHGLALTPDGEAYLPHVRKGFDSLRQAANVLGQQCHALTISVPPAFSAKWLVPRLKGLRTALPSIAIVNEGANETSDVIPANVDIAIRYGSGNFNDLSANHLLNEVVIPVCHPDLLASGMNVSCVEDILRFSLLHGRASLPGEGFPNWKRWFDWAGSKNVEASDGVVFDHHLMTVQAALEAQGVALAKRSIVMTDLIRGNLVQILDVTYPLNFAHYLVYRSESPWLEEINILREWVETELTQTLNNIPAPHCVRN
jgi:LysR family glycine cleavage system transcriptional activator